MNKNNAIRSLCLSAMIAAIYAALTMALPMLSYGPVQLRFSEALTVLPFFFPQAIPGLFLGCAISNILSAYGIVDVIFGSLATLLAALCKKEHDGAQDGEHPKETGPADIAITLGHYLFSGTISIQ